MEPRASLSSHERRVPHEHGRRDQPVRGIAGEGVPRIDPARSAMSSYSGGLRTFASQAVAGRLKRKRPRRSSVAIFEEADARHEKLVTLAVLLQRLSRPARQFFLSPSTSHMKTWASGTITD